MSQQPQDNLGGGDNGGQAGAPGVEVILPWDDFPETVKMNILSYLDRRSLNNLRQISRTARNLIESKYGLDVIIPLRRVVQVYAGENYWKNYRRQANDGQIGHILNQMEGKVIRSVDMKELPPNFHPFPFAWLVQHPMHLLQAKFVFVDIAVLHAFLRNCSNLQSLKYKLVYEKEDVNERVQVVSRPDTNDQLVEKLNLFSYGAYYLPCLTKLTLLSCGQRPIIGNHWGQMAYILVDLPVLPSLKTFKFSFEYRSDMPRWTRCLFLACLGDFLLKTPGLKELCVHSTLCELNDDEDDTLEINVAQTLLPVIRKFGSPVLKNIVGVSQDSLLSTLFQAIIPSFGSANRPTELSLDQVQELFVTAAQKLTKTLRKLELFVESDIENSAFSVFLRHLRGETCLTKVVINDFSGRTEEGDEDPMEPEAEQDRVYKLFISKISIPFRRLPFYDTLTVIKISIEFPPNSVLILKRIVEQIPQITSLQLENVHTYWNSPGDLAHCHYDANPILQSPFVQLEKLSLTCFCVRDLHSLTIPSSITGLILQCKNLKDLEYECCFGCRSRLDHATRGIHVADLLQILTSLRKLNRLLLDKVYFILPANVEELDPAVLYPDTLELVDQARRVALMNTGNVLSRMRMSQEALSFAGTFRKISDFDFSFGREHNAADDEDEEDSGGEEHNGDEEDDEEENYGEDDEESDGENDEESDGENDEESDGENDEESDGENDEESDGENDEESDGENDEESDGENDEENDVQEYHRVENDGEENEDEEEYDGEEEG